MTIKQYKKLTIMFRLFIFLCLLIKSIAASSQDDRYLEDRGACEKDDSVACFDLRNYYITNVVDGYAKANELFTLAFEMNVANAYCNAGLQYQNG